MNVTAEEPVVTVELSLKEAREFIAKNVSTAEYVPDISLSMAELIKNKLIELKLQMEVL